MPDTHEPHPLRGSHVDDQGDVQKPKSISVSASELLSMVDIVDDSTMQNTAFISRDTGKIYLQSDYVDPDEPLPDDLDDPELYIVVPDKHKLDLGRQLVLRFAETELHSDYEDVIDMFRRRGAYRHFKDLIQRRGATQRWLAFEEAATGAAIRDWCDDNGIQLIEDEPR